MRRVLRAQHDFKSTTLRNQLTSLVTYEVITTTTLKAKQLVAFANHFFNKAKIGDLPAKKLAHQTLKGDIAVKKTYEEVLPRYEKGATTFVRMLRTTPRRGDNAQMSMVLLLKPLSSTKKVEEPKPEATKAKKVATKTKETK